MRCGRGKVSDCVFCDIVAGNVPASVVYEDESTIAFMDLRQPTEGHVLVAPKQHRASTRCRSIWRRG